LTCLKATTSGLIRSGTKGSPLSAGSTASIVCGPFEGKREARAAAELARDAILLWATAHGIGVDTGDGHVRSALTDKGKELIEAQFGKPVRDDIQGIDVYADEDREMLFVRLNAEAQLAKNPDTFVEQVAMAVSGQWKATDKQSIAMELLSSSYFDSVFRSRFITLVTAVEALVKQNKREGSIQLLLDDACKAVSNLHISNSEKSSLKSGLQRLREESIGRSAAKLITHLLPSKMYGKLAAHKFFRKCYNIRSETVHEGRPHDTDVDFLPLGNELQVLVRDLILASIRESAVQQGVDSDDLLGRNYLEGVA